MLTYQGLVLIFVGFLNVAIGFLVAMKQWRNKVHISFWFFTVFIALWAFSLFYFQLAGDNVSALLSMRLAYVTAGLIGIAFWFFVHFFINKKIAAALWLGLGLLAIILSLLIAGSDFLVESLRIETWGRAVNIYRMPHFIFAIYFVSSFFGGLGIIWDRYRKVKGIERLQLGYIFWGVLVPGIFGSLFNLVLPSPWFEEWRFIWLGPVFTTIFVLSISAAIVKHQLLDIRIIAAELLASILIIIVGVEVFLSRSMGEAIFRILLFILVLSFGILLVRSVINEVKRREEMERLKNQLEVAYAKLKELDQAKTDFLSMASHQLRSPLTVVRLGIGALMDGTFGKLTDKRQAEALNKMLESSTRLINLIGEYLNVSRIELGKMKYNFKEQDLCALVRDIVEEYQPRAKEKGLRLMFAADGAHAREILRSAQNDIGGARGGETGEITTSRQQSGLAMTKGGGGSIPLIKFDEEKLRHVITNLIDNAIKYTAKGSVKVACEVVDAAHTREILRSALNDIGGARGGEREGMAMSLSAPRNDSGEVRVSIKDTGFGLDAEDLAVLFQKFRRAAGGNMRRRDGEPIEGSGLGLHVAKMFVEKHGGRIWAESKGRGKGSTFIFTLPLAGPPPLSSEEMGEGGKGVELPRQ